MSVGGAALRGVLVCIGGLALSSGALAHPPDLDDAQRQQRRMELRQHLMQERERWLAAVRQRPDVPPGLGPGTVPPAESLRETGSEHYGPEHFGAERSGPIRHRPHLFQPAGRADTDPTLRPEGRTERLSGEERRALRRAIREGQGPP